MWREEDQWQKEKKRKGNSGIKKKMQTMATCGEGFVGGTLKGK